MNTLNFEKVNILNILKAHEGLHSRMVSGADPDMPAFVFQIQDS